MSTLARRVEPEWLDTLPVEDLRAQRSRRDLARVNGLMGNARIVAAGLHRGLPQRPGLRLVELGAGDGRLAAQVLRRLPGRGGEVVLVDREPCVDAAAVAAMAALGWRARPIRAEATEFLETDGGPCDAVFANLFLHHLEDDELRELLRAAAARTRLFVACEPRRSALALAGSRLLGLIGCNDVTRHDAVASVRAGFVGGELSQLWPRVPGWEFDERGRGLFSHGFGAWRT